MRRSATLLTCLLLACTLSAAPTPASASPAPVGHNLIANGDFEAADPLSSWVCDKDTDYEQLSPGNEFIHVGPRDGDPALTPVTASALAQPEGRTAMVGYPTEDGRAECYQIVPVRRGSAYTLSASVDRGYAFLDNDYNTAWAPPSEDWTRISTTFTTSPTADTVRIAVHGWYGQDTFRVDDVTLTGPDSRTRVPDAPTGVFEARTTSRTFQLNWVAVPGAVTYQVLRDGAPIATVPSTRTSYLVTGLSPGQSSIYTVRARNAAGWSAESEPITQRLVPAYATPPAAPSGGIEATPGFDWVDLTFGVPARATDGYYVYQDGVRIGWLLDAEGRVAGLAEGTYTFEVTALNSAGESPRSEPVTVSVPSPEE